MVPDADEINSGETFTQQPHTCHTKHTHTLSHLVVSRRMDRRRMGKKEKERISIARTE